MKKTLLVILDWVWINDKTPNENPFYQENFPTLNNLFSNCKTWLEASGRAVWIPDGQIWNSEVGHMTIWAWRIIPQSIVKIDDMLDDWSFADIQSFKDWINHAKNNNSTIHLFTLFGPGWVHSSDTHLFKILKYLPKDLNISLHIFWDGRDIEPKSMLELYKSFENDILSKYPNLKVSSIAWRYFAMDRDNNWERVQKSYNQIVFKENIVDLKVSDYIENEYNSWKTDEFITPAFFKDWFEVRENDTVFFLNFRSDRAKQLTKTFVEENFWDFEVKKFKNLYFATMTKYYKEYSKNYFINDEDIKNVLWEVLQNLGLKQLHIAETEKFAHVTKFFNGWINSPFENETDVLIPSHKVATYDLDPEMSAWEIYEAFEKNINNFDFCVINFANWDMVGHTWNMDAVKISLKKLDSVVWDLINICDKNNIELLMTADHWNCEEMWTTDAPKTAHSTNLVPFWYISNQKIIETKSTWWLANIAPTVLKVMWLEIPTEMIEPLV